MADIGRANTPAKTIIFKTFILKRFMSSPPCYGYFPVFVSVAMFHFIPHNRHRLHHGMKSKGHSTDGPCYFPKDGLHQTGFDLLAVLVFLHPGLVLMRHAASPPFPTWLNQTLQGADERFVKAVLRGCKFGMDGKAV
jgi:hypothetical protein